MELKISADRRAKIKPDMIGLFFEDIQLRCGRRIIRGND